MKKIVLDFEQRQEEEEYQGGCVSLCVLVDCQLVAYHHVPSST